MFLRLHWMWRPLRLAAAVSCLTLAVVAARAADKPAAKASASSAGTVASLGKGGSPASPILSKDQLRQCLARQDDMKTTDAGLVSTQKSLDAEKVAIKDEGDAVAAAASGVDRSSQEAVDAYNARVKARNDRIDAYNQRLPVFNDQIEAARAQHQDWDSSCGNRRYFEEDLAALKAGH